MTPPRRGTPYFARRGFRLVSGAFGAVLAAIGLYGLVIVRPHDAASLAAGAVLLLLGTNMVIAAARGTEAWLSKLGPLP